MHGGLNRLHAAGLVRVRRDLFHLTKKALELYSKVEAHSPKRIVAQLEGLGRIMRRPCCSPRLKTAGE